MASDNIGIEPLCGRNVIKKIVAEHGNQVAIPRYGKAIACISGNKVISFVPVSYTHLDVYKRQAVMSYCKLIGHDLDKSMPREQLCSRTVGQSKDQGRSGRLHGPGNFLDITLLEEIAAAAVAGKRHVKA